MQVSGGEGLCSGLKSESEALSSCKTRCVRHTELSDVQCHAAACPWGMLSLNPAPTLYSLQVLRRTVDGTGAFLQFPELSQVLCQTTSVSNIILGSTGDSQ